VKPVDASVNLHSPHPAARAAAALGGYVGGMIFRSPLGDVTVPEVTLPAFVLEHAEARGDRPALIDGPTGRTLTYAGLARAVRSVAAGLAARGFGAGDVLALCAPNTPEYAVAFHAVAALGGVVTTINPAYTAQEMGGQLRDSGARLVVAAPPFDERAREAGAEDVLVLGEPSFDELIGAEATAPMPSRGRPDDVVALPYSSGTTGLPKGVMLTHRNVVANLCQTREVQPLADDDTVIGVLPFFHIYGMTVIMNQALRRGATVVTMPRFQLEGFLDLVERHRVTKAHLVPPIVLALAQHPLVEGRDVSSLRWINSGAAPLSAELADACAARLGCTVVQGYGLTETSPVTHAVPTERAENRPGSIGPPIPGTECKVVDVASGRELGPGEDGEVWIRGPQVMRGYLGDEESTADTLDDDGWLHTGDIGYADEDGWFYVVDRIKELIKVKGFQVAPAELEAVLLEHPDVADAAVVGSPDEEAGEVPKAFVVAAGEAQLDPEALKAFVSERVASYKQLRRVELTDVIPKSASGKVLRRVLVERERASAP
jgi:acyl-CoA synthetase (AMP-forming)/AMP-acid ligase II